MREHLRSYSHLWKHMWNAGKTRKWGSFSSTGSLEMGVERWREGAMLALLLRPLTRSNTGGALDKTNR